MLLFFLEHFYFIVFLCVFSSTFYVYTIDIIKIQAV